jgi:hypothetical protein
MLKSTIEDKKINSNTNLICAFVIILNLLQLWLSTLMYNDDNKIIAFMGGCHLAIFVIILIAVYTGKHVKRKELKTLEDLKFDERHKFTISDIYTREEDNNTRVILDAFLNRTFSRESLNSYLLIHDCEFDSFKATHTIDDFLTKLYQMRTDRAILCLSILYLVFAVGTTFLIYFGSRFSRLP